MISKLVEFKGYIPIIFTHQTSYDILVGACLILFFKVVKLILKIVNKLLILGFSIIFFTDFRNY